MHTVKISKFFLVVLSFCLSIQLTFAQAELCNGCYVWSFTNDKGERDETTRLLSDAVEDIISQYPSCILLQRSRFTKLQEQIANEKGIQSLNSAPQAIKDELKVIQAKRVIFGSVSRDFQGSVSLRLTFESLSTSQFKSNTIFLTGEDYYNFEKRKEKLTVFVNSFINPDGKMPAPVSPSNTPSSPSSTNSDKACDPQNAPYQVESNNVKLTLCKCYYYSNKITCPIWLTNMSKDIARYTIQGIGDNTRVILDYGKDYKSLSATIMSNSNAGQSNVWGDIPATKNGVPGQIVFDKIQTTSKVIESLEINIGYGVVKSFADVPLIHGAPPQK